MAKPKKVIPLDELEEPRYHFLDAVWRLVPKARKRLVNEVYPVWLEFHKKMNKNMSLQLEAGSLPKFVGGEFEKLGSSALSAIQEWAERFNINRDWVVQAVVTTFNDWTNNGSPKSFVLTGDRPGIKPQVSNFPPFKHDGWVPWLDSGRIAKRKEIEDAFKKHLDDHFARMQKIADKYGINTKSKKRTRESSPEERIEWLVRLLVEEWKEEDIVAKYQNHPKFAKRHRAKDDGNKREINTDQVRKHVKSLARAIGLQLPPKPRGPRPKK